MKRKTLALTAAAAMLIAAAAYAGNSLAHGPGAGGAGWGQNAGQGPGYGMRGSGPGMGMAGHGPGFGMATRGAGGPGDCPQGFAAADRDLSVDDVKAMMEHRLDGMQNDRLELGEISEQGEDSIIAEIVTQDGSVVDRLSIDRDTGRMTRIK